MKKVKIYSIHYDRPDFIEWQKDSFDKFLSDEFEYVVVNNARDIYLRNKINQIASELSIRCIETFSDSQLAGLHHAQSLNNIWQNFIVKENGYYSILLDGDCFLIKSLNVNELMSDFVMAGPRQKRLPNYHYLTPTIMIIDIDNLPEASSIAWEGIGVGDTRLDTGGGLYNYYCAHPEIKLKTRELKSTWHIKEDNKNKHCIPDNILNEYDDQYNVEFFGNEFLHYCRSSNWDNQSEEHHKRKTEFIKKFVYGAIDGSIVAKEHNFQIDNKTYFGWD